MAIHQSLVRILALVITFVAAAALHAGDRGSHIQIHDKNPRYW